MCQKQYGNYFAALASVPRDKFQLTRGSLSHFRSSQNMQRGFCRDCGTPLTYESMTNNSVSIALGSLDRVAEIKPTIQYGLESRVKWYDELFHIPACASGEYAGGVSDFAIELPGIAQSNKQHPDHDTDEWPVGKKDHKRN